MYGTRTKEEHVPGYWSAYTGQYHPPNIVPAGYTGLIRANIYREVDGMEMCDEDFLDQTADELMNPTDDKISLGHFLHYLVKKHFAAHVGEHSDLYHWHVETSALHGIYISFFLPEMVNWLPNLKFQYKAEDFYIEFTGDSEPSSEEYDEDYDY
jgi:hypothetical protein